MRMKLSRPGSLTFATLSLTAMTLAPVLAQDGSGLHGTFSFSQGIEYSDNPTLAAVSPGSEFLSVTGLGFNLSSETRAESFSLSIGTSLEGNFDSSSVATDGFEFTDTDARVSYSREGANSNLSFGANFREVDIDDDLFGFFVDGEFDPDALIIDGGMRESYGISGRFETGVEGPFGFELRARHNVTNYTGTTDPDLEDWDRTSVDATARFRLNPALSARALAGYSRIDTEDVVSSVTSSDRNTFHIRATLRRKRLKPLNWVR